MMGLMALGSALGSAAGAIPGAVAAGQNKFTPRDAQVDGNAYQYGGLTPEEQAAQGAQGDLNTALGQDALIKFTQEHGGPSFAGYRRTQDTDALRRQRDAAAEAARKAGDNATKDVNRDELYINEMAKGRDPTKADLTNALESRGQFGEAVGLYRNMANGQGPTAAQGMLQQGTDRAIDAGFAQANSARGGGLAAAAATRQAMSQQGQLIAGQAAQASQLRAQEQQAGMQGLASTLASQRAQDAQEAFGQANLSDAQRARDDSLRMGYENLRAGTKTTQLNANMQREQDNQRGIMGADQTRAGIAGANAAANAKNVGTAVQAPIAGAIGGADMYQRMSASGASSAAKPSYGTWS